MSLPLSFSRKSFRPRLLLHRSTLLLLIAALLLLAQYARAAPTSTGAEASGQASPPVALPSRGFSGALHAVVVPPGEALPPHFTPRDAVPQSLHWREVGTGAQAPATLSDEGLKAPDQPGTWLLAPSHTRASTAIITPAHFDGSKTHLNGYQIGRHPARSARRTGAHAPPELFIEVTPHNQDFALSEHFRLGQFLTKGQEDIWPKYLALDLRLVDKLELVLQELRAMGYPARGLHVMSGYRTPRYNGPGGKGRAKFSRHTYGDAADVWLDDDGDGQMDDLNGDGRIDVKDAEVLAQAVERVEQRHPELVGGQGLYRANRVHGPFVHIDVRGTPARWGRR